MNRFTVLFVITLFSFSLFPLHTSTQEKSIVQSDHAEQLFQHGIELFEKEAFADALEQFEKILDLGIITQRTSAAYVMSAKSMIELGRYTDAVQRSKIFLDRFPYSLYQADAYFTIGVAYYRDNRYEESLQYLIQALQNAEDTKTRLNTEWFLSHLINNQLTTRDLQREYNDAPDQFSRVFLAIQLSQRYITEGNISEARNILDQTIRRYPRHALIEDAINLRGRIEEGISLKFGVILPLFDNDPTQPIRQVGMEIYQGIQFALDEYSKESEIKISLEVRDSQRQPSLAARHVQELVNDPGIVAIVGPIFSDETFATAGVANARNVPLITPTATENHIAAIGNYIFQTNPDYDTRGRAMAQYAVNEKGYSTLAVLAPIDSHGRDIALGFIDEVGKIDGAYIAVSEWYRSGETNLRQQFFNIRKRGLQDSLHLYISFSGPIDENDIMRLTAYGIEIAYLDSLIENENAIAVTKLLGPEGPRIADSLGLKNVFTGDFYTDSLDVAVQAIDAIYLPITTSDEVGILSAQVAYYNIRAQLLGTGEWNNILVLEENRPYVNGAILTSDAYWDPNDSTFIDFYNRFVKEKRTRPTVNTLKGYDTVKILLRVIQEGATTRDRIASLLASDVFYRGIHTPFYISQTRVNSAINILQYRDGVIQKVDEVIVH